MEKDEFVRPFLIASIILMCFFYTDIRNSLVGFVFVLILWMYCVFVVIKEA
jgi:hypothetical protein